MKLKTNLDKITFLYTGIGRGHPFYLDGILEAIVRTGQIGLVRDKYSVFELSRGLSLLGWKLAAWLYQQGSSNSIVGKLYAKIRTGVDYNRPGFMISLMGSNIRREYTDSESPLLVAHPMLVGMLRGRKNLIYQHGEVVVPGEARVAGASFVLVPTADAGGSFKVAGYDDEKILVTGLCIEPALVSQADEAYHNRLPRLTEGEPLTGAFFSSGAEPKQHVEKLVLAAESLVKSGGRAIIFAHKEGRLLGRALTMLKSLEVESDLITATDRLPVEPPPVAVVCFKSRREENSFTARLFPFFDFFVAPSHERTNWALGLGLPLFIVGPCIGPFAPLNQAKLLDVGVAKVIDSSEQAVRFGDDLTDLTRSGQLAAMANAGWGKQSIDGFAKIAEFLSNQYAGNSL